MHLNCNLNFKLNAFKYAFFRGRSIPGIFVYLGDAPKIYENPIS